MKMTIKFAGFIRRSYQHFDALLQIIYRLCGFQRGKLCLCTWFVFKTLQVKSENFLFTIGAFLFGKKALACFIAQPVIFYHLIEPGRDFETGACFVCRAIIINSLSYFYQRVNAHYIGRAERSRFGATDQWSGEGIHFIDTEAQFIYQSKYGHDAVYTNAVGNECGRVFAQYCSLTQYEVAIVHQEINHCSIRMRGGNDFEQAQVAWWVEEVCTAKMFFKILTAAFCHQVNGNTRSIGSDQCAGLTILFYFFIDQLFDVQPFHYHFYDPVTAGNIFHVIIKIACADLFHHVFMIYRRGVAFNRCCKCIVNQFVALRRLFAIYGFLCYYVEQKHLYPNTCKMAGNT